MSGVSTPHVSCLCEAIDECVDAVLAPPLEADWAFVWLSAAYIKGRRGGRIVCAAAIAGGSVNTNCRRGVLGLSGGLSNAEPVWTDFLRLLTRRGLCGVRLMISDAHESLKATPPRPLPRPLHAQRPGRCAAQVPGHTGGTIRTAFAQATEKEPREQWRKVADGLRPAPRRTSP